MKKILYGLAISLAVWTHSYGSDENKGDFPDSRLPPCLYTLAEMDKYYENSRKGSLRDFSELKRKINDKEMGALLSQAAFRYVLDQLGNGRGKVDVQVNFYQRILANKTKESMKICYQSIDALHRTSLEILFFDNKTVVMEYDPTQAIDPKNLRITHRENKDPLGGRVLEDSEQLVEVILGARTEGSLINDRGKSISSYRFKPVKRTIPPRSSKESFAFKIELMDRQKGELLKLNFNPTDPESLTIIERTTVMESYGKGRDINYSLYQLSDKAGEKAQLVCAAPSVSLAPSKGSITGENKEGVVVSSSSSSSSVSLSSAAESSVSRVLSSPTPESLRSLLNGRLIMENGVSYKVQFNESQLAQLSQLLGSTSLIPLAENSDDKPSEGTS